MQDDVMGRAFKAYFRARAGADGIAQPANTSGVRTHAGKSYAVLENVKGVLAVYRVQAKGRLKGLKRWPKEIEGA